MTVERLGNKRNVQDFINSVCSVVVVVVVVGIAAATPATAATDDVTVIFNGDEVSQRSCGSEVASGRVLSNTCSGMLLPMLR